MELRPNTASIIRDLNEYKFDDDEWIKNRTDCKDKPLNIYEVHLGSWKKKEGNTWYNYRELEDKLIPYVKEYGYNYIEIMPLSEHPCDESWGYQNTGFFSPTSRYGTATDLKSLINACHKNNIGVLMDFVPVHFAVDSFALANYDGEPLYEYSYDDIAISQWGSKNFMHSKGEVRSFLQSAANYWIEEYHFDGLRVDALSNIIYWQGDSNRGENKDAVDFIKGMNQGLKYMHPNIILAAEDSTAYPKVTAPIEEGGLGFDYKWDMGWMNDTLEYFKLHPYDRRRAYHKLTFSMMYFYSEHFLMPLSHDEVVHGKATIIQKMHGEYDDKFKQARALYMYMYAHPGKKLNFMGNEIGQFREWDEKKEQDWNLLEYPMHNKFHRFMRDLSLVYINHPALFENDYEIEGFNWVNCHEEEKCIYVFERICKDEKILALFNFSDAYHKGFEVPIEDKTLEILMDSSISEYGGDGKADYRILIEEYIKYYENGNKNDSASIVSSSNRRLLSIDMRPYSAVYFILK